MDRSGPVLIAGGGIGGLTAALALARRGFTVRVFERQARRDIQLAGNGLTLWSNATTALATLGLGDELGAVGHEIREIRNLSETGSVIFRIPVHRYAWPGSVPGVTISRGDLAGLLLAAGERAGAHVQRGRAVCGYTADGAGVTVKLDDGSVASGTVLIGADGIRSAVHTQLRGELIRVFSGQTAYRGISDVDTGLEPGVVYSVSGRDGHSGWLWRISGGRTSWTFGRHAATRRGRRRGAPAATPALADLNALRRVVPAIVNGTRPANIARADSYHHEWSEQWGAGPVTLLGDAAHALPAVLGLGPAMAVEDAVVLAECLGGHRDPVAGLRAYEQRRKSRVHAVRQRLISLLGLPEVSNPALLWLYRRVMRVAVPVLSRPVWRPLLRPPVVRPRYATGAGYRSAG